MRAGTGGGSLLQFFSNNSAIIARLQFEL